MPINAILPIFIPKKNNLHSHYDNPLRHTWMVFEIYILLHREKQHDEDVWDIRSQVHIPYRNFTYIFQNVTHITDVFCSYPQNSFSLFFCMPFIRNKKKDS